MAETIYIEEFFELSHTIPVIDVRSPAEYEHAHIPSSINIPLLDNEERRIIGTMYKKKSPEEAIRAGFEIIAGKSSKLIEAGKDSAKNSKLLIYCWRGGMRSASVAWFFERNGIECKLLAGGYKTYRRHIKKYFNSELDLKILGGMTGSGKTEILQELRKSGVQVVDLEGIAHHKGSAFGSLGEPEQPTTEQFENLLFKNFIKLDKKKAVWLEDESKNIGRVFIPDELYLKMRRSTVYVVNLPRKERIERLVVDYGGFPDDLLVERIKRIGKKIGGQNMKTAITAIQNKEYNIAAEISLLYYDKAYNYGLDKRSTVKKIVVHCETLDAKKNADKILKLILEDN